MRGLPPTAAPSAARMRAAQVAARASASAATPKRAIITGGNTGIGLETAKAMAGSGWDVTLACRDAGKAAAAVAAVRAAAPASTVDAASLDLASLASVRDFCAAELDAGRRLDALVNNAGIM